MEKLQLTQAALTAAYKNAVVANTIYIQDLIENKTARLKEWWENEIDRLDIWEECKKPTAKNIQKYYSYLLKYEPALIFELPEDIHRVYHLPCTDADGPRFYPHEICVFQEIHPGDYEINTLV